MEQLAARFRLRVVVVTRGDAGSLLLSGRRWSRKPACAVDVQDSVGAGDAFTAALCVGLLRGIDLDIINEVANQVAAAVCYVSRCNALVAGYVQGTARLTEASSRSAARQCEERSKTHGAVCSF